MEDRDEGDTSHRGPWKAPPPRWGAGGRQHRAGGDTRRGGLCSVRCAPAGTSSRAQQLSGLLGRCPHGHTLCWFPSCSREEGERGPQGRSFLASPPQGASQRPERLRRSEKTRGGFFRAVSESVKSESLASSDPPSREGDRAAREGCGGRCGCPLRRPLVHEAAASCGTQDRGARRWRLPPGTPPSVPARTADTWLSGSASWPRHSRGAGSFPCPRPPPAPADLRHCCPGRRWLCILLHVHS